nr:MAG TPA: hypothetical protein [Caudoviricetes sp.]
MYLHLANVALLQDLGGSLPQAGAQYKLQKRQFLA